MRKFLPFLTFISLFFFQDRLLAQTIDTTMWITNRAVRTVLRVGNIIYLGGEFDYVGPNTGSGVVFNTLNGNLAKVPLLRIEGEVKTSLSDGKGGWYIGGSFSSIQGVACNGLAHILANGTIDKKWPKDFKNDLNATKIVYALALSGTTVYIGGRFTSIAGKSRNNLATIDALSGEVTSWNPNVNGIVRTITLSGNSIYVGGNFTTIGEQERNRLASFDSKTGELSSWNPNANDIVFTIAVSGNIVFAGGSFSHINNEYRNCLVAINASTGKVAFDSNNLHSNSTVFSLIAHRNTIYAGGMFTNIGGQRRNHIASFNSSTCTLSSWNPDANETVTTLSISDSTVFAGGQFTSMGGQYRLRLAAIDIASGQVTSWKPNEGDAPTTDRTINTLAVFEKSAFIGGKFASIGGKMRNHLAAIDALSGQVTSWNPDVSGIVNAIAQSGNSIYIGGKFYLVNGQTRIHLAAIDAISGDLKNWNPNISNDHDYNVVTTLKIINNTVYVGGIFTYIGEKKRNNLAAIDVISGEVTSWNPDVSSTVETLSHLDNTLFVGGSFGSINGELRNNLASFDIITGDLNSWNPLMKTTSTYEGVYALASSGGTVYVGGRFVSIGGQSRNNLVAIDALSGEVTSWNPNVNGIVWAITLSGNSIYVGGDFTAIDGQERSKLASFDSKTGELSSWNPVLDRSVRHLNAYNEHIYVGGEFTKKLNKNLFHVAHFVTNRPKQYIKGYIFEDINGDCKKDVDEKGTAGRVIMAQPGNYFALSDTLGNYSLEIDSGNYTVEQVIPQEKAPLISQICPANSSKHNISIKNDDTIINGIDFANQTTYTSQLSVAITSSRRRRCSTNTTFIYYQNSGTKQAEEVKVYIKLPEYVILVSANMPYTQDAEKNYVFSIGSLAANRGGSIQIIDSVICNRPDIRGLTQCTKVWITPTNVNNPSEWDKSDISLKAKCLENGRVRLAILNQGEGSMADSSTFHIFLNATLVFTHPFKLISGDSLVLQVPANGQTLRLEADQSKGHPTKQQSSITLEACGTNAEGKVSIGYVNQLPQDDPEPEVAIDCLPIVDSFDPNDKGVSPIGLTSAHYTPTSAELKYQIRFQNTGTDYAYKVVVIDTLSEGLDISTLQIGAVSHPYKFTLSGKGKPVLIFTFDPIHLPDSSKNQLASNGYINFSIKPKIGLAEKTRIENYADICFDFNEPVRTNIVFNSIYDMPLVVEEASKLDQSVMCIPTNSEIHAGINRVICESDTIHLQGIAPIFGKGQWRVVGGKGKIQSEQDAHSIVSELAYGDNIFEWKVSANSCGVDSLNARVIITRVKKPLTPSIIQKGVDSLQSTTQGHSYHWFLNDQPLDEKAHTIHVNKSGSYSLQVEDENGCRSEVSAGFLYFTTGVESYLSSLVRTYPNPTPGKLTVELPAVLAGKSINFCLYDGIGRQISYSTIENLSSSQLSQLIDLSSVVRGMYILKITSCEGVIIKRIYKK